jgi:hypothetical protein
MVAPRVCSGAMYGAVHLTRLSRAHRERRVVPASGRFVSDFCKTEI